MKQLPLLYLLLCSLNTLAQGKLQGTVYYMNSNKTPAFNVKVKAIGANGDHSNSNGHYELYFPHLDKGKITEISIGDQINEKIVDGNGEEIEMVNNIRSVIIPEDPNAFSYNIIICKKGERDLAARKYFGILKNASEKDLEEKTKELEVLLKKFKETDEVIITQRQELKYLQSMADSLNIYKQALQLASLNKDMISERMLKHLTLLEAGVSVQEAAKVLDVEAAFKEGSKSIEVLNSSFEEIRIIMLEAFRNGEYEKGLEYLEKGVSLADNTLVSKEVLISFYFQGAQLGLVLGNYSEINGKTGNEIGTSYARKALDLSKVVPDEYVIFFSIYYLATYRVLNQEYDEAESLLDEAFQIIEDLENPSNFQSATLQILIFYLKGNLIKRSSSNKQSLEAIDWFKKGRKLVFEYKENFTKTEHFYLLRIYNEELAKTYLELDHYEESINYYRSNLKLSDSLLTNDAKIWAPYHVLTAKSLALIYLNKTKNKKEIDDLNQEVWKDYLDADSVLKSYVNLEMSYFVEEVAESVDLNFGYEAAIPYYNQMKRFYEIAAINDEAFQSSVLYAKKELEKFHKRNKK